MIEVSYAVVIPTNRVLDSITPLLNSLVQQSLPPKQVVIVRDTYVDKSQLDMYTIWVKLILSQLPHCDITIINHLSDPHFQVGKWASYVRNYGMKKVTTDYMMYIDDDNVCPDDMCENLFGFVEVLPHPLATLVAPVQYDDTASSLRPALASGLNFALCRPIRRGDEMMSSDERYFSLQLASSNCLAGSTDLFRQFPFPEDVPFVYEDLIVVARMAKAGIKIYADSRASVIHHHSHRNRLAELYANTPDRAYYKAKHRIILIHILGNWRDKCIFYMLGFIGQLWRIGLHILYYAPASNWWKLFAALWKWSWDGIRYVVAQDTHKKNIADNEHSE